MSKIYAHNKKVARQKPSADMKRENKAARVVFTNHNLISSILSFLPVEPKWFTSYRNLSTSFQRVSCSPHLYQHAHLINWPQSSLITAAQKILALADSRI